MLLATSTLELQNNIHISKVAKIIRVRIQEIGFKVEQAQKLKSCEKPSKKKKVWKKIHFFQASISVITLQLSRSFTHMLLTTNMSMTSILSTCKPSCTISTKAFKAYLRMERCWVKSSRTCQVVHQCPTILSFKGMVKCDQ